MKQIFKKIFGVLFDFAAIGMVFDFVFPAITICNVGQYRFGYFEHTGGAVYCQQAWEPFL